MNLPSFITDLLSAVDLGEVSIEFGEARTKENKLVLPTKIEFMRSVFWPMRGELEIVVEDESVSLYEEDPDGLIIDIMNAGSVAELPEAQADSSEFVRWLAKLKHEEFGRKQGPYKRRFDSWDGEI